MAFYHNILRMASQHENPHLMSGSREPALFQHITWDKALGRYREVTAADLATRPANAPKRQRGSVREIRHQPGNRHVSGK